MGQGHHDQVVRALRETPFDASHWAVALGGVAAACGAASAQLLSFGECRFAAIVAPGFSPDEIADFVTLDGANPAINHGLRAVQKSTLHEIICDSQYLDDEQRRSDRLYNEFFFRFDGDHVASGTVARNPGATCNINLFLPRRTGELDGDARRALRRLLPHFTQALRLTTRLEGMAAALASGIWDELGEAAFLCDAAARVIHANAEAERLLESGDVIHVHRGALASRRTVGPIRLGDAIAAAAAAGGEARSQSLIIRTDHRPTLIDIMPLPAMSGLLSPLALILVRRGSSDMRLDAALVEAAFALTPAERGVAEGLLQRLSSAEIAQRRNVSIETVNSQIKAILAKTGCPNRGAVTHALQPFLKPPRRDH